MILYHCSSSGASSAAAIGSKTAIYSVKIGSALSRLAGILKSSAKKLWEMAKVVKTITKFSFSAFKKFTIGKFSLNSIFSFLADDTFECRLWIEL